MNGVLCPTCTSTYLVAPQTDTYTLTTFDKNGCATSVSLKVQVDISVRVFVPNAIRPGSGGPNEDLIIFGGPEVAQIRSLQLFDRWGNQVFEQYGLLPNVPSAWDGTFRGKLIQPGVLVWFATVETIDGRVVNLSGDITVLR
ncbi:MAG: gliding motility-associated C-terminal domain-containing protein [Saprospiraceae bacterium]|nr:gliding motility-associated C-terminal domain-containing protein [Saprospiraceae bacterium]